MYRIVFLLIGLAAGETFAQNPNLLPPNRFNQPGTFALTNVSVIDGTGAPVKRDQVVLIADGLIRYAGPARGASIPPGAEILDLRDKTVMPGLIMMHEHIVDAEHGPRLFLANGVTTVRAAGTFRPFVDLTLKRWILEGRVPGPELFLSSPFVTEPRSNMFRYDRMVLRDLKNEHDARAFVRYWASEGVDAIKVYTGITPAMLRVVTDEAHRHGLHVLGHLAPAVTSCVAAAEAEIDSIEHGFSSCVSDLVTRASRDVMTPAVGERINRLARFKVAITETPVDLRPMTQRELDVLHPGPLEEYRRMVAENRLGPGARSLNDDRQGEPGLAVAFVRAGGRLMLGSDSGPLHRLPGFMNIRSLMTLYSEFGFSPVEAIRIATLEAATFLKIAHRTGTVSVGKEADLVVVDGDPSRRMADVRNIALVFSNGVRYDPAELLAYVKGNYLTP